MISNSIDDKKTFLETFEALNLLNFGIDDRRMIFKTLAAVLQLGNVQFVQDSQDSASISVSLLLWTVF